MKCLPVLFVLLVCAPAPGKETPPPADHKVLTLEPFKINDHAIISFAVNIAIYSDPKTRLVNHIFITRVLPGTDAEEAGLQPGDEIVKLDGEAVKGMDSKVVKDSPLGRILLNRDPGEALKIEVITRRTAHFTLHAHRGSPLDHW